MKVMIDFLYTFLNFLQPGILWPELEPYRPMLVIAILAAISALVWRRAEYSRLGQFSHPAFLFMTVFIAVQVLSVYYSGVSSMFKEFERWHVPLLFAAISLMLINNAPALKRYVWGMMVGSMVVILFGLYAVYAELPNAVGGRAGAYGMYENHNDYTFIIVMVLPFLFFFWSRHARGLRRLFLGVSVLACVAGVLFSLSRGGMLALILEIALIVMWTRSGIKRVAAIVVLSIVGGGAAAYQWAVREESQSNYTAAVAQYERIELWKAGLAMIKAHPFLGVGSRRFGEFSQQYGEISGDNRGKNAHNTYVDIAATSGLIGLLSFLLFLRSVIRELRVRMTVAGYEWMDSIRLAALISLCTIMFRALLDVKSHDWSFYILASIAIVYGALRRHLEARNAATQSMSSAGESQKTMPNAGVAGQY